MARVAGFPITDGRQEALILDCFGLGTALPGGENAVFSSLFFAPQPFLHAMKRESHCLTGTRHLLYFYQRAIKRQQYECQLASLELGYDAAEELAGRATARAAGADAAPCAMEDSDDEPEAYEAVAGDTIKAGLAALAVGDPRRDRSKARLRAMIDSL